MTNVYRGSQTNRIRSAQTSPRAVHTAPRRQRIPVATKAQRNRQVKNLDSQVRELCAFDRRVFSREGNEETADYIKNKLKNLDLVVDDFPKNKVSCECEALKFAGIKSRIQKSFRLRAEDLKIRSFEDSLEIVNYLKDRKSVIVNLQYLDREVSQRVIDFVSGATLALDGSQERVGHGVFIFASMNCQVETESEGIKAYKDLFAKTFG